MKWARRRLRPATAGAAAGGRPARSRRPEPGVITVAIAAPRRTTSTRASAPTTIRRGRTNCSSTICSRLDEQPAGSRRAWRNRLGDCPTTRPIASICGRACVFHDGHELTSTRRRLHVQRASSTRSSSPPAEARSALSSRSRRSIATPSSSVLKQPSGVVPGQSRRSRLCRTAPGASCGITPSARGRTSSCAYAPTTGRPGGLSRTISRARRATRASCSRSCPTTSCAGWNCAKRTVDLVVNDLAPDMVYQLEKEGLRLTRPRASTTSTSGSICAIPILRERARAARHRLRHRSRRPSSSTCAAAWPRRGRHAAARQTGRSSQTSFDFAYDPGAGADAARRGRLSGPGRRRPAHRGFAVVQDVERREFNRLQAAVIQQNLTEVGIELDVRSYEFATLYADILKGNFQMYTLQWVGGAIADPDILRRVFHSQQVPPAGFNRGHFSDPEVDRLIDEAHAGDRPRRDRQRLYGKVQQRVAERRPTSASGTRPTSPSRSRSSAASGCTPQADFTFLRNVSRYAPR